MLPGFSEELEKLAKAGFFGRIAGGIGRAFGTVGRTARTAGTSVKRGVKGTIVRTKGEFRRGLEEARGLSPQPRLQKNIKATQAAKAKAESLARAQARQARRAKMRNVLIGAGALGAGAGTAGVVAHKLTKKKEPEYPTLY